MVTWFIEFFNTLKNYVVAAAALVAAIFAAMFFYERRKAEIEQTLLDEDKMNQQLEKQDEQLKINHDALAAEEQKRKELENEKPPTTNVTDITKWFNNRK